MMDRGPGLTATEGVLLATRLLPFDDFVMTSGAVRLVRADTLRRIRASVLPRHRVDEDGRCALAGGRQKAADLTPSVP
jgi:hypothetical protein